MSVPDGLSEAITYVLVWRAHAGACHKCLALNGYVWTLPSLYGNLVHPTYGVVYDLTNEVTWAHPYCHCSLDVVEIEVDLERVEVG